MLFQQHIHIHQLMFTIMSCEQQQHICCLNNTFVIISYCLLLCPVNSNSQLLSQLHTGNHWLMFTFMPCVQQQHICCFNNTSVIINQCLPLCPVNSNSTWVVSTTHLYSLVNVCHSVLWIATAQSLSHQHIGNHQSMFTIMSCEYHQFMCCLNNMFVFIG